MANEMADVVKKVEIDAAAQSQRRFGLIVIGDEILG